MRKRYIVDLTEAERAELRSVIRKGIASARRLTRARILLLADEGRTDEAIAAALHVHPTTVERIRQRFVAGGVARALRDQPRPGPAEARPQAGGVPDRARLQRPAERARTLDAAAVGRPLGCAGNRRRDQR
jgi:hypothetical protein